MSILRDFWLNVAETIDSLRTPQPGDPDWFKFGVCLLIVAGLFAAGILEAL